MTTATNGWPGKPGVPLNPEKDGPHWIYDEVGQEPALWNAKGNFWQLIGTEAWFSPRDMVVRKWRYLGPCLTPDQATALQARVAELEAALRDARARYIELNDKDAAEAMAEIINKALADVK